MNLGKIVWGGVDWFDRNNWRALANAVMNLRIPYNAGKLSSGYTTGNLSSRAQLPRVS
jgi:hypothetical protein